MYKIGYRKDRNSETNFLVLSNGKVVIEDISEERVERTEGELRKEEIVFQQGQVYRTLPDFVLDMILSLEPDAVAAFKKRYAIQ